MSIGAPPRRRLVQLREYGVDREQRHSGERYPNTFPRRTFGTRSPRYGLDERLRGVTSVQRRLGIGGMASAQGGTLQVRSHDISRKEGYLRD